MTGMPFHSFDCPRNCRVFTPAYHAKWARVLFRASIAGGVELRTCFRAAGSSLYPHNLRLCTGEGRQGVFCDRYCLALPDFGRGHKIETTTGNIKSDAFANLRVVLADVKLKISVNPAALGAIFSFARCLRVHPQDFVFPAYRPPI
jgi:hypothetical protein